jgi:hypothetical protein
LAISKVARSSFGFFNNFKILCSLALLDCSRDSISFGVKEKKAVSALENNAEKISDRSMTSDSKTTLVSIATLKENMGGGSMFIC